MLRFAMALAALSVILTSTAGHAEPITPEVQKILDAAADAYRSAANFSTTLEMKQGTSTVSTRLILTHDGKLDAVITTPLETRHVVADGTTIYSDSSTDAKKYTKQPGTKLDDSVTELARLGGAGVGLLPILLTSPAAQKQIIPGKPASVTQQTEEKLDGVACDVVSVVLGDGARKFKYQFAFGKADHFLRRLVIGPVTGVPAVTENYKDISTAAAPDTAFKYVPEPGAVAVAPAKSPAYFDPALKVGSQPFALAGSDLEGRTVSLSDYKGKVLMLDFWATWCGPCVAELPNVLQAYRK